MTLEEARYAIGATVRYTPPHGVNSETGVITSVGSQFVFVRYEGDNHSKATHPANLTILLPAPRGKR